MPVAEIDALSASQRAPSSDAGAEVSPAEFAQLLALARNASSEGGARISLEELKTLFAAAKDARVVKYAAGQLGLTIDDLRGVYAAMLRDGSLDAAELTLLFEAAIAPKDHAEAGASVSQEEVALFNGLD
jgi:hypothetical protein